MNFIKSWGWLTWTCVLFFAVSATIFFVPRFHHDIRELFAPSERKILSVAIGQVVTGANNRVVKLLTPRGIIIEVFGETIQNVAPLIDTIELPDQRDAHFQFQGRATNLALKDMDDDGTFEIIAPSYDRSLVPHLNIYRYNSETHRFEAYVE